MLEAVSLSKRFLGRPVLQDVSATFFEGRVHGLLGHNGAGKTVFLKLLIGVYSADAGRILLGGRDFSPLSPRQARQRGVAYVPQIPYLPGDLTIQQLEMLLRVRLAAAPSFGFSYDHSRPISCLPLVERQLLECRFALAARPRVLLIDEPGFLGVGAYNNALTMLLDHCREARIVTIVVLHDPDLAYQHCDAVLHFIDGQIANAEDSAAQLRAFREFRSLLQAELPAAASQSLMRVQGRGDSLMREVSVPIDGAASLRLLQPGVVCVYGATSASWSSYIDATCRSAARHSGFSRGVSVIPGHRPDRGLALNCTVGENLVLAVSPRRRMLTLLQPIGRRVHAAVDAALATFGVTPATPSERAGNLSGGNKQRLAYARALSQDVDCVICVNPWRGLDAQGIRALTVKLLGTAEGGASVLILTDNIDEARFFAVAGDAYWIDGNAGLKRGLPTQ